MKAADKINLIEAIGTALQQRYTFNDVRSFLRHHDIDAPTDFSVNSKRLYVKAILEGTPTETIVNIARELNLPLPRAAGSVSLPHNWRSTTDFRLFYQSHLDTQRQGHSP